MLLILGTDRLLYRGPPVDGTRHRHHALQVAISLDAPLTLETEGAAQQAMGFIIAADIPHQLSGGGAQIALFYLEPESAAGRQLQAQMGASAKAWIPSSTLHKQLASVEADGFGAVAHRWLAELGVEVSGAASSTLDPRVADTLAHLAAMPGESHSAALLAARVQLSPDRLMHLFAQNTGVSLRSYALWAKLKTAVHTALAGATLTEAAHAAGFADSAHLSHSFKAMFGLPPSFLFEQRSALTVRFLE